MQRSGRRRHWPASLVEALTWGDLCGDFSLEASACRAARCGRGHRQLEHTMAAVAPHCSGRPKAGGGPPHAPSGASHWDEAAAGVWSGLFPTARVVFSAARAGPRGGPHGGVAILAPRPWVVRSWRTVVPSCCVEAVVGRSSDDPAADVAVRSCTCRPTRVRAFWQRCARTTCVSRARWRVSAATPTSSSGLGHEDGADAAQLASHSSTPTSRPLRRLP